MTRTATLTYADLEGFPEDARRRELIEGELLVTPSPVPGHQKVVTVLCAQLLAYARDHGGLVFVGPIDIVFGPENVVAPDIVYVSADRVGIVGDKAIHGAPTLIVEVLSPSTAAVDRGKKRRLYALHGVREYWIVDLKARAVERCSQPTNAAYLHVERFEAASLPAAGFPELVISLDELFSRRS